MRRQRSQCRCHIGLCHAIHRRQVPRQGAQPFALQAGDGLACVLGRVKTGALQQQAAIGVHQLEVELAVGLAVLLERGQRGLGGLRWLGGRAGLRQAAQAHGRAQFFDERRGQGAGAIEQFRNVVDAANLYVTEQEPWKIAKDEANKERLATVLYCVAESLRAIAVLYHAIMPESTTKIWNILGANESIGDISKQLISSAGTWGILPAGSKVNKGEAVFPRLAEDEQ